jgi:hypothetical protein
MRPIGTSPPAALAAVAFVLGAACSTTYQPRPAPRVGLVIQHGGAFYLKDGQLTPVGPFGGDLEPLLAAAPQSALRARRARHQLQVGVPLYVLGLAGVVASLAAVSGRARWPLAGAGAGAAGAGLSLMGAGFTNAVDAINIHNDALDEPPGTGD